MPRLKPETEAQRRDAILEAAELCFSRAGFHRTTMQDICREARVSPGALYLYFKSKEDLIAGLCQRDRVDFERRFQELAEAPDFLSSLDRLASHYFAEEPAHKRRFVIEMGLEATRNPRVAETFHATDRYCRQCFEAMFERLKDARRIEPDLDTRTLAEVFQLIGDGLMWRRAVDPTFDAAVVLPGVLHLAQILTNPTTAAPSERPAQNPEEAHCAQQVSSRAKQPSSVRTTKRRASLQAKP